MVESMVFTFIRQDLEGILEKYEKLQESTSQAIAHKISKEYSNYTLNELSEEDVIRKICSRYDILDYFEEFDSDIVKLDTMITDILISDYNFE